LPNFRELGLGLILDFWVISLLEQNSMGILEISL
jgi:hypothetical protein